MTNNLEIPSVTRFPYIMNEGDFDVRQALMLGLRGTQFRLPYQKESEAPVSIAEGDRFNLGRPDSVGGEQSSVEQEVLRIVRGANGLEVLTRVVRGGEEVHVDHESHDLGLRSYAFEAGDYLFLMLDSVAQRLHEIRNPRLSRRP